MAIEVVTKKKENKEPISSELVRILSNDKQLNEDKPRLQLFLSLAALFDNDLKNNLKRTSFELDDKYSTMDAHSWLEFKNYPSVRTYIQKYLDEEQLSMARKTISESGINRVKDAIDVQAIVEGKQKADQNTNIIVFLMPQVNYTSTE